MEQVLDLFRPGRRIYIPGASGEILTLADALSAEPGRLSGVDLTSCLLPGFNGFDYAALDADARLTCFLLPPALRPSFIAGRTRIVPLPYSAIVGYLEKQAFDIAFFHVAPPDASGLCSLGISADFAEHAWKTAKCRVFVINPSMPRIATAPGLSLAEADLTYEIESALITGGEARTDPVIDKIAQSVATLVPDGATVQFGIGGVPGAMWRHLTSHRNLTIASGMVTPGWRLLRDNGALRPGRHHRAGVALGDGEFYEELARQDELSLVSAAQTHHAETLSRMDRFTAVNSALEVDLFGQANLEWRDGRIVSGVGGALDFACGAIASPGGRAVTALRATAAKGTISRIVPRLTSPTISLSRNHVDTVVTEFGVAELRGKSLDDRAASLIDIAAPDYRDSLEQAWRELKQNF